MSGMAGTLFTVAQIHRAGGGVLAAELSALGLGGTALGLIMGSMYLASAGFQPPIGVMFDRLGARRTVSLLALVAVLGTLLFAFAAGFWALLFGRILIGIGFAGAQTGVLIVTLRWVAPERFTATASIVIALAGGTGALLATAPLAYALQGSGWAATFGTLAVVTAVLALAVYLLVRDRPDAPAAPPPKQSLREGLAGMVAVARRREFRRLLPMTLCTSGPYFTVVGLWAGPYLRDVHGLSAVGLGYVLLAAAVGWNLGVLGYGPLDRLFNTRKRVVLAGSGTVAVVLALLAALPSPPLVAVAALLLLFSLAAPFQITLAAHALGFLPQDLAGRGVATMQLFGITGVFALQFLTGIIVDLFSVAGQPTPTLVYRLIFALLAVLVVWGWLAYAGAPDVRPRPSTDPGDAQS